MKFRPSILFLIRYPFFRAEHVWFDSPSSRETVEGNRKPGFHKSLNRRLWANFKNLDVGQGTKNNAANEHEIENLKFKTTTNHQRGREGGKDRKLRQVEKGSREQFNQLYYKFKPIIRL